MTFRTFYKAGKFAKDWKKSLKIVSLEKNVALQAQSLLWRLDLLANEDSNFGAMFLEFEQMIEKCIAKFSRNHCRKKSNFKDTGNYYKMFKTIWYDLMNLL
jgi:hypothetical protein